MNFLRTNIKLFLGITFTALIFIASLLIFFNFNNSSIEVSSSNTINQNSIEANIEANKNEATNNVLTAILDNVSNKEDVPEIVTDEKVSDKELKKEKVKKTEVKKSTSPYYIKVNYEANVVTIYTKDKNDKYTVPHKAMVCSCGTYTPKSGTYKMSSKYRWGKLIHDVYGQYASRIVGSILFHSVPYSSNKNDTLLYNQYDKLGITASAGCVRLTVKDAKWIYDNCPRGTMVEFYSSSTPGPLGKPTAQKISSVEECRNWDPTDPAAENPWHTYEPETNKPTTDIPNIDKPSTDTPTTDIPTTEEPDTNAPSTDTPTTEEPDTNAPSTDTPTTEEPDTNAPSTDTPTTEEPSTNVPSTDTPSTEEPETDTPNTDIPSTKEPETNKPNTDTPSTKEPDTNITSTDTPTIGEPNTNTPSTNEPSTDSISTTQPTDNKNI